MHCSISWNILFKVSDIKNISVNNLPFLVKILYIRNNQLVTKDDNKFHLVGTSETIRASSIFHTAEIRRYEKKGLLEMKASLEFNKEENLFNE
jgi:hypothetical protein